MPYINAMFVRNTAVHRRVRRIKTQVRVAVAFATGYRLDEVAFFSTITFPGDVDSSENTLPLEFAIDTGKRIETPEAAQAAADNISRMIRDIPGMDGIHFGVWVRAFQINGFKESNPNSI